MRNLIAFDNRWHENHVVVYIFKEMTKTDAPSKDSVLADRIVAKGMILPLAFETIAGKKDPPPGRWPFQSFTPRGIWGLYRVP